jgi:hypothetical protein
MDHGAIRPVPVARAEHVEVHAHRVVRLQLQNGRVLRISPGHPTADGIDIATLRPGDEIGGQTVASIALIPYEEPATYDILPLSDSGAYFAAGMPLGSTLSRRKNVRTEDRQTSCSVTDP